MNLVPRSTAGGISAYGGAGRAAPELNLVSTDGKNKVAALPGEIRGALAAAGIDVPAGELDSQAYPPATVRSTSGGQTVFRQERFAYQLTTNRLLRVAARRALRPVPGGDAAKPKLAPASDWEIIAVVCDLSGDGARTKHLTLPAPPYEDTSSSAAGTGAASSTAGVRDDAFRCLPAQVQDILDATVPPTSPGVDALSYVQMSGRDIGAGKSSTTRTAGHIRYTDSHVAAAISLSKATYFGAYDDSALWQPAHAGAAANTVVFSAPIAATTRHKLRSMTSTAGTGRAVGAGAGTAGALGLSS